MRSRTLRRRAGAVVAGTPTFSVLLAFFNERETLGEAVESVRAQTYADWELVAVDDGSTDGSEEIVARYAAADPRIRLVRRPNGGLPAARNTGIAAAHGRYCALLDADDVWLPEKLERQLPLLGERRIVFSDAWAEEAGSRFPYGRRVNQPDGVYPSGDVFDALLRQNFVPSLTAVAPTRLLREVGGFDETLSLSLDWDLWLRFSLQGVQFAYVPEPLAVYAIRSKGLSSDQLGLRSDAVKVLRLVCARVDASRSAVAKRRLRLARRELEVFLRKRAWTAATRGDTDSAKRELRATVHANPRSPRAYAGVLLTLAPPLLRWYARRRPPASFAGEFVHH